MTPERQAPALGRLVGVPVRRANRPPATDLVGTGPDGTARRIEVTGGGAMSLLLFLTTTCDGCEGLWEAWAHPGRFEALGMQGVARVLAVTKDANAERMDLVAGRCAPEGADPGDVPARRLVLSSAAWSAYGVLGPPFFVLVDGAEGVVATEGVAWAVGQVASDVARAITGAGRVPGAPGS